MSLPNDPVSQEKIVYLQHIAAELHQLEQSVWNKMDAKVDVLIGNELMRHENKSIVRDVVPEDKECEHGSHINSEVLERIVRFNLC